MSDRSRSRSRSNRRSRSRSPVRDRSPAAGRGGFGQRSAGGIPHSGDLFSIKVDNLSYNTTEADLKRKFEKFGEIGDCFMPLDRYGGSGKTRGFGFIRFYKKQDMEDAVYECEKDFQIDGRDVRVEAAKERPNPNRPGWDPHRRRGGNSRSRSRGRDDRRRSRSRSRGRGGGGGYQKRDDYYRRDDRRDDYRRDDRRDDRGYDNRRDDRGYDNRRRSRSRSRGRY